MELVTDTGNGANVDQEVLAKRAVKSGEPTAVHSTQSPSIKSQTVKENLTGQDVLSILENALWRMKGYCQTSIRVISKDDSTPVIIVMPPIIRYCHNCQHLRLAEDMDETICRYCQS